MSRCLRRRRSAQAQTADFSGSLSIFLGTGSGVPTAGVEVFGSGQDVLYAADGSAFTIPASVFVDNRTTPMGFTSAAPVNTLYDMVWITNSSNGAGSFQESGGTMSAGQDVSIEGGIVPLPNNFFSLVFPINVGISSTVQASASVLANAVTVSVDVGAWTTAVLTISDQTPSAPSGTFASTTVVSGTRSLATTGGSISLVAPILVRIRGAETRRPSSAIARGTRGSTCSSFPSRPAPHSSSSGLSH